MAILNIENNELSFFLDKLSGVIDFDKDLPANVFFVGEYQYWFFERPLLCFFDIFSELVAASILSFKSNVYVKFSGGEPLIGSCFSIDKKDIERDSHWLIDNFEDFFGGRVGYPIVLCNSTSDWFAFESAYEEFGVLAINKSSLNNGFVKYLNSNFISMSGLVALAERPTTDGLIAKAFISSYGA